MEGIYQFSATLMRYLIQLRHYHKVLLFEEVHLDNINMVTGKETRKCLSIQIPVETDASFKKRQRFFTRRQRLEETQKAMDSTMLCEIGGQRNCCLVYSTGSLRRTIETIDR